MFYDCAHENVHIAIMKTFHDDSFPIYRLSSHESLLSQ